MPVTTVDDSEIMNQPGPFIGEGPPCCECGDEAVGTWRGRDLCANCAEAEYEAEAESAEALATSDYYYGRD